MVDKMFVVKMTFELIPLTLIKCCFFVLAITVT